MRNALAIDETNRRVLFHRPPSRPWRAGEALRREQDIVLTCREMTELVTDYLEGRLSFVDRLRFRVHVGMCRRCRAYLRQTKTILRALGRLAFDPLPAEMPQELLRRFRDWKK